MRSILRRFVRRAKPFLFQPFAFAGAPCWAASRDQLVARWSRRSGRFKQRLRVTHLDTHKHAHVFPRFWRVAASGAICGCAPSAIHRSGEAISARLFKDSANSGSVIARCAFACFSGSSSSEQTSGCSRRRRPGVIETGARFGSGSSGRDSCSAKPSPACQRNLELVCHPGIRRRLAAAVRACSISRRGARLLTSPELRQFWTNRNSSDRYADCAKFATTAQNDRQMPKVTPCRYVRKTFVT